MLFLKYDLEWNSFLTHSGMRRRGLGGNSVLEIQSLSYLTTVSAGRLTLKPSWAPVYLSMRN